MARDPEYFRKADECRLPGTLGIRAVVLDSEKSVLEMEIAECALNFHGFIHGGSVVTLADTAAGYGCYSNLPEGANSFTTIELKCNFLGGVANGILRCDATRIHSGKTTQVWDSTVTHVESNRVIAEFRCTQLILYPKL